jgi:hypothetical protein
VKQIRRDIEQGDSHAAEQLLPLVYDELRSWRPRNSPKRKPVTPFRPRPWSARPTYAWSATARSRTWNSRAHFFAAAAEAKASGSSQPS